MYFKNVLEEKGELQEEVKNSLASLSEMGNGL